MVVNRDVSSCDVLINNPLRSTAQSGLTRAESFLGTTDIDDLSLHAQVRQ